MKLSLLTSTIIVGTLVFVSFPVSARLDAKHSVHAQFKGTWFTVQYPAGWTVRSPHKKDADTEFAFFTAPDRSAEFYVFSPLWNGDPKEVALNPGYEVLLSQRVERNPHGRLADGSYMYNPEAHWYTARAKDNSYQRSWVDVEDRGLNTRRVFGIKYRDQAAYQKHRAEYADFCKSLQQFSD